MPAPPRPGPAHAARVSRLGRLVLRLRHRGLTRRSTTKTRAERLTGAPPGSREHGGEAYR